MTHNIFTAIRDLVLSALYATVPDLPAEVAARVEVTPTRDAAHGDMATNAAMVGGKAARRKPRELASALAGRICAPIRWIAEASAAGPGFVNLAAATPPRCWRNCR